MPSPNHPNNVIPLVDRGPKQSLFGYTIDQRTPMEKLTDEVAGLREEIRALRDDRQQLSAILVTGPDAVAEFRRLTNR